MEQNLTFCRMIVHGLADREELFKMMMKMIHDLQGEADANKMVIMSNHSLEI